ncbi:rhodoquinone biosynthesis methyltransferase RquA [Consotaella salsifontis]|uniref:Ubiquinone/menaquinone biosynthesis C-methylase UbiE n=1 Tax=Consotaella salsifontis TaxID=1365950 RepID=A0A1T4PWL7_9HYPH|nr:rhodoquinone biosynthesis methyltransferase RquA [Consotaella salsifontis]SJZ95707.1 Ubiquinone/menaquinone biosynthesis C-methylase UbiE [Consotaella salsifontis]
MLQEFSETSPVMAAERETVVAAPSVASSGILSVPDYLRKIYTWCYLHPKMVPLLDRQLVVQAILWGNANKLIDRALEEFEPGQDVYQPAHAYGTVAPRLAELLGPKGHLDIIDIAPIQIERCHKKLDRFAHVTIRRGDAANPPLRTYDAINCFFLLHEVPDSYKRRIVDGLLGAVKPGGKVVFIDYHRYSPFHPLRPIMWSVFRFLEPFANSLCWSEIRNFASRSDGFEWSKEVYFGGLYQKVVARRIDDAKA